MPHERFFYPHELIEGSIISLPLEEEKHLRVMRVKPLESVEIVNGLGFLATATLQKLEKKEAPLKIDKVYFEEEPVPKIIIAQSLPRVNRLDFIVEKGTELGMSELWLFPGEFSEKKELSEANLNRLRAITIAALKQCGRLYLPKIVIKPHLKQWSSTQNSQLLYFGSTSKNAPAFTAVWKLNEMHSHGELIFFVGPEKGFSDNEEECLLKINAKGIKLHESILRTDTASLAFLSIVKQLLLSTS